MIVQENIFAKLTAEKITMFNGEPGQGDINQLESEIVHVAFCYCQFDILSFEPYTFL